MTIRFNDFHIKKQQDCGSPVDGISIFGNEFTNNLSKLISQRNYGIVTYQASLI